MLYTLAGHCGPTSSHPCFSCDCAKEDLLFGKVGKIREYQSVVENAKKFQEKNTTAKDLTKLRSECLSSTQIPLLNIPFNRWIYGAFHAISGPVITILAKVEDVALSQDLNELGITVPSQKDKKLLQMEKNENIRKMGSYIKSIQTGINESKVVLKVWGKSSPNPQPNINRCNAKYCLNDAKNYQTLQKE